MLLSIVTPCYNSGEYLEDAVASVLNQTFGDWEMLIVDDGSTEAETLAVLSAVEAQSEPRIRVLRQPNAGPAAARNTAIVHAKGKYILPLDADDTIEPSYMAQAIPLLESDPNLGIVYCKARKFGLERGLIELPSFSHEEMAIDNVIFCTSFFRRDDWETVGGYSEALVHGLEDYDFWLKILNLGREVHRIDEILLNVRSTAFSRTVNLNQNKDNVVAAYAEIFRNNMEYFARHAEALYRHRFLLESKFVSMSGLKRAAGRWLRRFPYLYWQAKRIYGFIKNR